MRSYTAPWRMVKVPFVQTLVIALFFVAHKYSPFFECSPRKIYFLSQSDDKLKQTFEISYITEVNNL